MIPIMCGIMDSNNFPQEITMLAEVRTAHHYHPDSNSFQDNRLLDSNHSSVDSNSGILDHTQLDGMAHSSAIRAICQAILPVIVQTSRIPQQIRHHPSWEISHRLMFDE